jgi:tyrosine aminotransferase
LHQVIDDAKHNGYPPSTGYQFAREAVARKLSEKGDLPAPLEAADIVLASGCSGALDLALCALCDPGTNVLIPAPGFSLYRTLAESYGFECRPYSLDVRINALRLQVLLNSIMRIRFAAGPVLGSRPGTCRYLGG